MCLCVCVPPKPITVDRFLVQGFDKVAGILYGVLEVADGVCAATLTPHALLGSLCLVLEFTESGLLWTVHTKTKKSFRCNTMITNKKRLKSVEIVTRHLQFQLPSCTV